MLCALIGGDDECRRQSSSWSNGSGHVLKLKASLLIAQI